MTTYYKICSDCGTRNSYTLSACSKCGSSIVMARTVSEEEPDAEGGPVPRGDSAAGGTQSPRTEQLAGRQFRKCQVCDTLNYLSGGRDVRVCRECGNDELYKSPVEQEVLEASDPGQSGQGAAGGQPEEGPGSRPGGQTGSGCRRLSLECLQESFRLEIPEFGGIVGRNGTIGQAFFQNRKYVSGEHAFFSRKGETYVVVDRKSTNKTRINGEILEYGVEYPLADGALITFADVSFRIRLG